MPRPKQPRNTAQARLLRRAMSLPETLLWQHLRNNPQGIHFRRQHPIGNYIVDFCCAAKRTAFEIDGTAHDMGDRPVRDISRDAWLCEQGVQVVRIPASEVLKSPEDVAEGIVRFCTRPRPLRQAQAAPDTSPFGFAKRGGTWRRQLRLSRLPPPQSHDLIDQLKRHPLRVGACGE